MEDMVMLIEDMWGELMECDKYCKRALKYKDSNKSMADAYSQTAREEFAHFERFHEQAIKCLNSHKDDDGKIPAEIHIIWTWEIDKLMARATYVKNELAMLR